jgi:hypothetical protein
LILVGLAAGGGDPDVDAAREGLHRLVDAYADWPPARPLECPLVGREVVNDALTTAGIDSPLPAWEFDGTTAAAPGMECSGSFVGVDGDPSNPETTVALEVTDTGTSAEAPEGGCDARRLATTCTEAWNGDGLTMSLTIVDRVFLDGPTTEAVLADVVPVVIGVLAANASDIADPLNSIDDQSVADAAAGLDAIVGAGLAGPCPAIDAEAIEAALAGDETLAGWDASIDTVDSETVLDCGGSAGAIDVTLKVAAFDDSVAAADFVASVALPEGGSAGDLPPGEVTVGSCVDAAAAGRFCTEWWWRNGVVVGVWLLGQDVTESDAAALLVAIVPAVIDTLAGAIRAG